MAVPTGSYDKPYFSKPGIEYLLIADIPVVPVYRMLSRRRMARLPASAGESRSAVTAHAAYGLDLYDHRICMIEDEG